MFLPMYNMYVNYGIYTSRMETEQKNELIISSSQKLVSKLKHVKITLRRTCDRFLAIDHNFMVFYSRCRIRFYVRPLLKQSRTDF